MPFNDLKLHPSLIKGIKELGFVRPTPIQADAIPPAMEGRDVLACAQTGSGKTAAFLLPILHKLIDKPRGTTRALVIAPTRELAAQILEDLNDLAVHTPITGASIFGGVGMGPQEHAFRSGVDVLIATPGRLLDHLRAPYAKLTHLEFLVLDEADRMLDMGFLPEIRKILRYVPAKRQTLFFSATMPPEIAALTGEMLRNPATIQRERQAAPAVGDHAGGLSGLAGAQAAAARGAAAAGRREAGARLHADEAPRQPARRAPRAGGRRAPSASTATARRRSARRRSTASSGARFPCWSRPTSRRAGSTSNELGHVVNFDVPLVPDDYIHRVGRTGRAEATGDAFTFVSPEEDGNLRDIERAIGRRLPRVTRAGFRLQREAAGAPRGAAGAADRGDSGAEARRAGARRGQRRAPVGQSARAATRRRRATARPPAPSAGRRTARRRRSRPRPGSTVEATRGLRGAVQVAVRRGSHPMGS